MNKFLALLLIYCTVPKLYGMEAIRLDDHSHDAASFVKCFLKSSEPRSPYSPLNLVSDVQNLIAQTVLKESGLLSWLIQLTTKKAHFTQIINSAVFDPSGMTVAAAFSDKTIRLFDTELKCTRKLGCPPPDRPNDLAYGGLLNVRFSPDGTMVVANSGSPDVYRWDLATGHSQVLFSIGTLRTIAFNKEGTLIAVAGPSVTIIDAQSGREIKRFRHISPGPIRSLSFNRESTQLTIGTYGSAQILDYTTENRVLLHYGTDDRFTICKRSPDEEKFFDKEVEPQLDLTIEIVVPVRHYFPPSPKDIRTVEYNPDGTNILLSFFQEGEAKVWDVNTGQWILTLEHGPKLCSAGYNKPGTQIVTAGSNGLIKIWNSLIGECVETIPVGKTISSATFDNSGNRILAITNNRTLQIYDLGLIRFLKNSFTLQQVLLLYAIFETDVLNRHDFNRALPEAVRSLETGTIASELNETEYLNLLQMLPSITQEKNLARSQVLATRKRFDLNSASHLQALFDSLPEILRTKLEPYVIQSKKQEITAR